MSFPADSKSDRVAPILRTRAWPAPAAGFAGAETGAARSVYCQVLTVRSPELQSSLVGDDGSPLGNTGQCDLAHVFRRVRRSGIEDEFPQQPNRTFVIPDPAQDQGFVDLERPPLSRRRGFALKPFSMAVSFSAVSSKSTASSFHAGAKVGTRLTSSRTFSTFSLGSCVHSKDMYAR